MKTNSNIQRTVVSVAVESDFLCVDCLCDASFTGSAVMVAEWRQIVMNIED